MRVHLCDNCGCRFEYGERPIAVMIPLEPPEFVGSVEGLMMAMQAGQPREFMQYDFCTPACASSAMLVLSLTMDGALRA